MPIPERKTLLLAALLSLAGTAAAADAEYHLVIRDHRFEPTELTVPAGQKITLLVSNEDSTPEEFESHDLKREKIIVAKGTARINVGPLKPGTYAFVGEYNEKTAQGKLIVE